MARATAALKSLAERPGPHSGMATTHPFAMLRMPGEKARRAGFAGLVRDLRAAARWVDQ